MLAPRTLHAHMCPTMRLQAPAGTRARASTRATRRAGGAAQFFEPRLDSGIAATQIRVIAELWRALPELPSVRAGVIRARTPPGRLRIIVRLGAGSTARLAQERRGHLRRRARGVAPITRVHRRCMQRACTAPITRVPRRCTQATRRQQMQTQTPQNDQHTAPHRWLGLHPGAVSTTHARHGEVPQMHRHAGQRRAVAPRLPFLVSHSLPLAPLLPTNWCPTWTVFQPGTMTWEKNFFQARILSSRWILTSGSCGPGLQHCGTGRRRRSPHWQVCARRAASAQSIAP